MISRLAFGTVAICPTSSRESGYRELSPYLPTFQLDAEGSSDFSYQINRPRQIAVDKKSCKVNRLGRWSVSAVRSVQMMLSEGSHPKSHATPAFHAVRVEVDIVRRQSFWDIERFNLREALARLVGDVTRPADDAASVDWRWSVV